jgi:hypothetical protein
MAEEEFDDVRGTQHVCRGFEGGLRKAVKVDDDQEYQIGDTVVFVVEAVVGRIQFAPHEDTDEDEDGEGFDRLHISKLATVTVVERDTVAAALDSQRQRNDAAQAEREAARAAIREKRKAERAAERERAKTAGTLFEEAPTEDDDDSDLTDAERKAKAAFAA